jgi:hypothetical protein
MTEQPNDSNIDQVTPKTEKLLIDDQTNFQFHAAFLVYEEAFDKASDSSAKEDLNRYLMELKENKIDYESFYQDIARYRKLPMPRQEKFTVQTQRKKDWRMKTQRQERIKRHKK